MKKPPVKLIEDCIKGKGLAQKRLFELYKNAMLGICYRYARDKAEAEDMMIEGFLNIFKKIHTYAYKGSFAGWMRKTMVCSAIDYYRKYKKENFHSNIEDQNGLVFREPEMLEKLAAEDILKVIRSLPSGYQMVFNLFVIEGYSHKEIASLLNISESTSKTQYRKARLQLIKELKDLQLIL